MSKVCCTNPQCNNYLMQFHTVSKAPSQDVCDGCNQQGTLEFTKENIGAT